MPLKDTSQSYYRRFPLLSLLGIFFCFILFPAGLINLGLEQLFKIREANSRDQIIERMDQALKIAARFNDNDYFAHYLLLKMHDMVFAASDPQKTFALLKGRLQRKYPNAFTFIFWDQNGELIKSLSDETSYSYILRRTYQTLKKASQLMGFWHQETGKLTVGTLADLDKDLKILRNFLGKLLVTYQLKFPWLSGDLGQPLQTSPPGPRSRMWYRINEKFGFLVFINDKFIKSRSGQEYAVAHLKKQFPEFSIHFADYPNFERLFPEALPGQAARLVTSLSRFENLSPIKMEEFEGLLVACEMVSQIRRVACAASSDLIFRADKERFIYLGKLVKVLVPLFFLLAVWFFTRRARLVSLRYKMVALFLYAGGIPILIMGSIGFEYLEQRQQQMVYEAQTRGANVLYRVDENFQLFLENMAAKFNEYCKKLNHKYKEGILEPEILQKLQHFMLSEGAPESFQLFNERGQMLLPDLRETIFSDHTITGQIAAEMIKTINTSDDGFDDRNPALSIKIGLNSIGKKREIFYVGVGINEVYMFFDFLGDGNNYAMVAMLQMFWRLETLQKIYFERHFRRNLAEDKFITTISAYYPQEDSCYPDNADDAELKRLGQQAFLSQIVRKNRINVDEKDFAAVALRGKYLNRISLVFLQPLKQIEQAMQQIQLKIILMILTFLSLSALMFRFLANQFLQPVAELKKAVSSIESRDFSFRLKTDTSKEFYELADTFNITMEALKDLETAKIVQENLLPAGDFMAGNISLKAFSQPFSRVGGDYYDFFSSGGQLCVFIGDVSGHGISAALVMAMAKGTVLLKKPVFERIDSLINDLDQTIFLNRNTGTKEYMTGLLLSIDEVTGSGELINRGHCMPAIVKSGGSSCLSLRCGGLPLGYNAPQRSRKEKFQLEPGDTLCLYTDGLVESLNREKEPLGYEGLMKMLHSSWDPQLEVFMHNFLGNHNKWSVGQDDDQTLILLRRSPEGSET